MGNRHLKPLFEYAIVSDTHIRPPGESSSPWQTNLITNDRARWVTEQINIHKPDLVIHLGDIVHPVPHLPTYGSASMIANEIMGRIKAPVYYVPGNHDVGDKDNPTVPSYIVNESYQNKFIEYYGPLYQSFNHHGVHFILINSPILNSGLSHEAKQREWLEIDLEENKMNRIHMFSHYPPYIYLPHEPSNYDNLDEPARSWLLALLEEYDVEAFFAGHVHHYGYKSYGCTKIHNLFSTCFVRQDYAEMFKVEATDEYGRNDAAKLGYCTVEVYEAGHVTRIHRSFGKTLESDGMPVDMEKSQVIWGPSAALGVHLRHPLAESVVLPYNGPLDEFVRKKAWNDYTLLGLLETGFKELRLPLNDLLDPVTRSRLSEIHNLGYSYGFFTINILPDMVKNVLAEHRELVDFIEMIIPWETSSDAVPQASFIREELSVPIYVANIESSVHRERESPKYSHYLSHGFRIQDSATLDSILPIRGTVDGFVFQVGQHEDPFTTIKLIDDYARGMDIRALINVRLASENPAEFLCDENHVANRAAESIVGAMGSQKVKVFLDTFMDQDRGYFPRIGLYDRRLNPRKGSYVARNLIGILKTLCSGIELDAVNKMDGWRFYTFHSSERRFGLLLPQINKERKGLDLDLEEFSGGEIIDLETGRITPLSDVQSGFDIRATQYLVVYP